MKNRTAQTERARNKAAADRGMPQTFTIGKSASEWRAKQEPMGSDAAKAMRHMNNRRRK